MKFEITDEDMAKVNEFRKAQNEIAGRSDWGAIGGVMTYSFTPTGIGLVLVVTHGGTKAELDLTNTDDW